MSQTEAWVQRPLAARPFLWSCSKNNSNFNALLITFRTFLSHMTVFWRVLALLSLVLGSDGVEYSTSEYQYQRWSRGHKARGQGQGHKKNPRPRPRTAFPRTDTLEAKDRNARGQGQGPRTQPQVLSKKKKKKALQKFFSGNLQFKGAARIFDWGGLNHKSRAMTSSKICLLALNQDFAPGEGLN